MSLDYLQVLGITQKESVADLVRNHPLEELMDFYRTLKKDSRELQGIFHTKLISAIANSSSAPVGIVEELLEDEALTSARLIKIGEYYKP